MRMFIIRTQFIILGIGEAVFRQNQTTSIQPLHFFSFTVAADVARRYEKELQSNMRYLLVSCLALLFLASCTCGPKYREAPFDGNMVSFNAASLAEGVPEFYSVTIDGRRIGFFIVKVQGEVQSYFDACLGCYPKKLGFRVDGNHVICRSCNIRYPIEELKTGVGSCYPIRLAGKTENGVYRITREALKEGGNYF